MSLESVTIFTDGSSRGNPGPGGFGAVVITDGKVTEVGGREEHTTNNRMEIQAAISALSSIQNSKFHILIYSDSSYVINGITKWVFGWQKNGWKTLQKKEVENRDLWEALIGVTKGKTIEWKQVGGHVGVAGNVRCDEIATAFADGTTPKLYSGILENYSIKNILDVSYDAGLAKEKSSNRAHSNAKAYSYVSLVGGVVQTHKTWAECEARVKGKPAKFKKALSANDEQALISEWNHKH
ncbi:MAG: ribonuclease HI [Candidatus Taylorbacteria bacterium]|nr:ribonuclease HI [Candidatus Taylorbacteria bacterium]